MPDIDGFKLLETGLEMGFPVIMMSAHSNNDNVVKGTTHSQPFAEVQLFLKKRYENMAADASGTKDLSDHPWLNLMLKCQYGSASPNRTRTQAYPIGKNHHETLLPRAEKVDLFQPTPLEPLPFPKSKHSAYKQPLETAIKLPNTPEVTKKDPVTIEPFSYGGATRRHRFFFPLMLAAAIALSTFLWFCVSL
ncbi:unnamed protein product [Thlaspi arvense]|uniref:Response regulatory domain-containing protein n=1 Tax=Thlaspi arvense TaxID=13288 RepID=A0AAU9SMA4_THLAR|nr:unnamed protein product [Thlaspi arvense]